ncbi:MAG: D-alanine--D-alanine ligase [Candidatus Shapirobacteria bacterium]|nr:D-alanine--D-alanine ligase [Candidatus Shapirobacteria bacterium]
MIEKKLNLGIVFGGKSPEHEVSIITAFQVWPWINKKKYQPFLIYLNYNNQAFLCPSIKKQNYQKFIENTLRKKDYLNFIKGGVCLKKGFLKKKIDLDTVLLLTHGGSGENGQIQGLLDFFDIPYTGSNLLTSAITMDKVLTKESFTKIGLKTLPYFWFEYKDFKKDQKQTIADIENKLKYPLFVKPARSGSSIGINKVKNRKELVGAIDKAAVFDNKILIEESLKDAIDINCAVMGGSNPLISPCEQPLSDEQFLSFQEKYLKGSKNKGMASLSRIIPAPIPEKKTLEIKNMAKIIFEEIILWGMSRIDFLYQKETSKVYPNEINSIPGSLAFYLWQAKNIQPQQLIDKMIDLAIERKKQEKKIKYFFKSEILNQG